MTIHHRLLNSDVISENVTIASVVFSLCYRDNPEINLNLTDITDI